MLEQSKTYTAVTAGLQQLAQDFLATGVAVLQDVDYSDLPYSDWQAKHKRYRQERMPLSSIALKRSFIRHVAKDLKRPIVFAERDGWRGKSTHVTIKRIARNAPLVAHFLMVMDNSIRRFPYRDGKTKRPTVEACADLSNWYVQFHGDKGEREFDSWLAFLNSDPACRKALKL